MSPPSYAYGAHQIGKYTEQDQRATLEILQRYNVSRIDTALVYDQSEKQLSKIGAVNLFTIDTKSPAFAPKALSRESLISGLDQSLSVLGKIDVYYLHAPDKHTPIEETIDTIQELHRQGKFERFGLSNLPPGDVRRIYTYARSKGGVLPSVYQSSYNAFSRAIEKELFGLLRELSISCYAYSPAAGGFFAKNPEDLASGTATRRFDSSTLEGQLYNALYNKPVMVEALRQWQHIAENLQSSEAKDVQSSSIALAYRWATFHSRLDARHGDVIILGASGPQQLEQTLKYLQEGPLRDDLVERIEALWSLIEDHAPIDNVQSANFEF